MRGRKGERKQPKQQKLKGKERWREPQKNKIKKKRVVSQIFPCDLESMHLIFSCSNVIFHFFFVWSSIFFVFFSLFFNSSSFCCYLFVKCCFTDAVFFTTLSINRIWSSRPYPSSMFGNDRRWKDLSISECEDNSSRRRIHSPSEVNQGICNSSLQEARSSGFCCRQAFNTAMPCGERTFSFSRRSMNFGYLL